MKRFLTSILISAILFLPSIASAQVVKLPQCATADAATLMQIGPCDTCDFISFAVSLVDFGFQLMSIIVLFTFVLGGFLMLISPVNANFINKGKAMIVGSIIGIIFAFGGYLIVNVVIGALMGVDNYSEIQLFRGKENAHFWYEYCKDKKTEAEEAATIRVTCEEKYESEDVAGAVCMTTAEECVGNGTTGDAVDATPGLCPSSTPVCCVIQ